MKVTVFEHAMIPPPKAYTATLLRADTGAMICVEGETTQEVLDGLQAASGAKPRSGSSPFPLTGGP